VRTDPESPAGQHKNIFCEIVIMHEGEPISLRSGSTELQIDKPLPVAQAQPMPMPMPMAQPMPMPEQPAAKPLSRLEKLRLAAEQRKKEGEQAGPAEEQPASP
jgi:hypothetical protein